MLASYHNHTPLCHHATGREESYILRAIECGYRIFGFSDHAPHIFTDMLNSSRMKLTELGLYTETVGELREKYKDLIDVKLGLELEYYPDRFGEENEIFKRAGIEYYILGQHLIGNGEDPSSSFNSFTQTDKDGLLCTYVNQTIEALKTEKFSYFAHPDVFKYKGDDDFYRSECDRLIKAAMEHNVPLEVNLLGLSEGRHYPNPLFWERVSLLGARVIFGRDAHTTERVHSDEELTRGYRFADKYGLNVIDSISFKIL